VGRYWVTLSTDSQYFSRWRPVTQKSVYVKMRGQHYHKLLRLARLLYELQPQEAVVHSWKGLLHERLRSHAHAELGDLLIRQMTLLNRTNRVFEKGAYHSEQADLLMALQLLQREYKKGTLLSPSIRMAYARLLEQLGTDRVFRRSDVERITGYKKTSAHHLVKVLERCGKMDKVGGTAQAGFFYQLKE